MGFIPFRGFHTKKTAEVHSGDLSCGIYTKSQWLLYAMDAFSRRFDKYFANLIY